MRQSKLLNIVLCAVVGFDPDKHFQIVKYVLKSVEQDTVLSNQIN